MNFARTAGLARCPYCPAILSPPADIFQNFNFVPVGDFTEIRYYGGREKLLTRKEMTNE